MNTKSILLVLSALILSSCTKNYPPSRKSYIQIEKPPMRVVIFDNEDIDPVLITKIMKDVGKQQYQNYSFNENTASVVSGTFLNEDIESNADIRNVTMTVPTP